MDARLVRDFDETYQRVLDHRKAFKAEPYVPGQASTERPNPAAAMLARDGAHLRGLARLIGPKECEEVLKDEWKAAEKMCRWLVEDIGDQKYVRGAKGSYVEHPMSYVLAQTQTHLRGCVKLLKAANAEVPLEDAELAELLD